MRASYLETHVVVSYNGYVSVAGDSFIGIDSGSANSLLIRIITYFVLSMRVERENTWFKTDKKIS